MNLCGVAFKENGKIYNFLSDGIKLNKNDYVIVETEKGHQLGKVVSLLENSGKINKLKSVIRIASKVDYNKHLKNLSDAKNALLETRKEIQILDLKMRVIDCSYTFDRKQLLFNFIADERVDFRELVKILASKFKTRIELHQIGVRDKSKEIGGIGHCGRVLCCADFLNFMETISINMAKNQNIALNPNKINGACGRLLCCLAYEDDIYIECRREIPNIGDMVKIDGINGKVISVDILNQKYKVNLNDEIKEIKVKNGCNKK
ncbi:MAG: regulatory iron-sulfur-containing complex subunit RicT [Bacilli bacterium]|nr:regulatory iron-sulfur-containing complex subunit RicT [Bacilli bacterium]MDD4406593.1 regulatory iron-sulfur-containing complex subunit RicT [Bacilli bacterium]